MLRIRLAFASSAVLVLLGLTAAPSLAAPAAAQAAARHGVAEIDGSSVPIGSTGKPITVLTSVCCTNAGQPVAYTGALTVTVDAAGAAGVLATTVSGPGCGTSGTVKPKWKRAESRIRASPAEKSAWAEKGACT